ncbi:MAG: glycosyltransferase family 2 protein [Chromatiales bacterium]|nr:glycosyltransferase family 2 protein [Chromatiales bacterium]
MSNPLEPPVDAQQAADRSSPAGERESPASRTGSAPVVSVIVPVHNAGVLLNDALNSIFAQRDAPAFEVIVVDDRSDDPATLGVLSDLADARVRVIQSDQRPGPAGARNAGIAQARGEWLAFLDADDRWPQASLAQRFQVAQGFDGVRWIAGRHADWDALNDTLTEPENPLRNRIGSRRNSATGTRIQDPELELGGPPFLRLGAMLIHRDALAKAGGFDTRFRYGEDWLLWLKLALGEKLVYQDAISLHLRRHAGSMTAGLRGLDQGWRVTLHALAQPGFRMIRPRLRWTLARQFANAANGFRDHGHWFRALGYAIRAVLVVPNSREHWRRIGAMFLPRRGRQKGRTEPTVRRH